MTKFSILFTAKTASLIANILISCLVTHVASSKNNSELQSNEFIALSSKMPEQRIVPTIESLEEFKQKLPDFLSNHNRTLSLFCDYDGTLAPIADNPNKTAMPVAVEILLNRLAQHPQVFLAIISGRGLVDVQARVGIEGITYAGNHGLEIQTPDGRRHDYQLPESLQQSYKKLVQELNEKVVKNGAWVEDKRVSLTYHYRDTPADLKDAQKEKAIEIIEAHGLRANQAHEAIEAKPPVNWNKGEAALFILRNRFGKSWLDATEVIFVGDDNTDEDAMRALQGIAKSFRISSDPEIHTFADFRLPQQMIVKDLLQWIADGLEA